MIDSTSNEEDIKTTCLNSEKVKAVIGDKEIKKVIVIKGRLVNIIA